MFRSQNGGKKGFPAKGQMVRYTIKFSHSLACRFQFRVINETGLATEWQREDEGKTDGKRERLETSVQIRF